MWSRFWVAKIWNVILRKTTKKINEKMVKRSIKEFKVTLKMSLTQNKSARVADEQKRDGTNIKLIVKK